MNRIITLLIAMLTIFALTVSAEDVAPGTDANIYGHVVNKKNGEHLPYIAISVKGTTIGTTTDASGHYFLKNLPEGLQTLEVKAIGYRTLTHSVTVKANTTQEVNFELEENNIALDEVVVSANRAETTRRAAPVLVNVLGSKLFENTQASCLAQGLGFQPGVRVEDNCQNCGFTQVRINGLDGHYSQILIDSRPVFSALNGVYGLEQIPANMIDRVEVIRGGGSALFGASAIGGTINIITKDPIRNSAEAAHTITGIGGSKAWENNTTMNASIVTDDRRAGLYVYGQNRYRQGYDDNGDGYTELPKLRNQTIGLSTYYRLNPYSKLSLRYHGIKEFRRGGNMLDYVAHEANIAEQVQHNINGGGLNYDFNSPDGHNRVNAYFSFQDTKRDSYYGGTASGTDEEKAEALKDYGITHDVTMIGGTQYIHSFDRLVFMPSDLTVGGEFNYDALHDKIIARGRFTDQTVRIWSGFIQNEWKNKYWSLLLGGRLDKHSMLDHVIFSPRVNVRFNPSDNFNFRASYADGFRAPQTFDEDLHVGMVGGELVATRLAKGLKEERSHSFSLSADMYHSFGNVQANLLIEGFYTIIDDMFHTRLTGQTDADGYSIQERYNTGGAKVYGLNIEGKVAPASWFNLQAGITLQKSMYDQPESWNDDAPSEKRMLRTPNTYGYFTATLNPVKKLTVALSGNYTGRMLVGHSAGSEIDHPVLVNTPTFFTINAKVAYDFLVARSITLQANAGIQNITDSYQKDFDRGWNRDSDYIYGPSMPRCWFAGVKVSF